MSLVETMSLFDKICYKNEQYLFFEYIYFKQLATKDTYSFIIQLIVKNIDAILSEHDQFDGHVSFKTITIGDIDKHFGFWQCMDTKRDHDLLEELWSKNAPWV